MAAQLQSDQGLFDRRPGAGLIVVLAAFVGLFLATIALPDNRYIRFQQLEHTVVGRSRWDYERIHFDPTPIDIAVVGDSRTEASISAPNLEAAASAAIGHHVDVANLSIPQNGRNLDFVIAKELLLNRPELKLMLLAMSEPSASSQPAFKQLADAGDVFASPIFVNHDYLDDLSSLPFRSLKLFFMSLAPAYSGFAENFDRHHYQGTHYDTSGSFTEPDGVFINRDKLLTPAFLDALKAKQPEGKITFSHRLFGRHENVIEDAFEQRIAGLAASRGVKLLFIHIPGWRERHPDFDVAQVSSIAPLLAAPDTIAADPANYTDEVHLGVRGSRKVGVWLARALTPIFAELRSARDKSLRSGDMHPTAFTGRTK